MEIEAFFQTIKIPATVIHVISVVFGMGSALTADALFSFFSKDKKLNATEIKTLSILAKIVFYSLWIIVLSGIALFLSDVPRYSHSVKFLGKMSILLILVINGYALNKYVWPHLLNKKFFIETKERAVRKLAFVSGAVSVVSWLSVCILGVLDSVSISYEVLMGTYGIVIGSSIFVALAIEKKEFN